MVYALVPTIWAYALVARWRKLWLQGQVKTSHTNIVNLRVSKLALTIRANKNPFSHTAASRGGDSQKAGEHREGIPEYQSEKLVSNQDFSVVLADTFEKSVQLCSYILGQSYVFNYRRVRGYDHDRWDAFSLPESRLRLRNRGDG
jgi:hypothetical protein